MTDSEFQKIINERISKIVNVLGSKAEEYASDNDRLHNFKQAALTHLKQITPEEALWGMMQKHIVSVMDIVNQCHEERCKREILEEKIGDWINYLVLLEALLKERFGYE